MLIVTLREPHLIQPESFIKPPKNNKKRVYTALIEVAKIVWRNGKVMQFVNDDLGIEILELKEFEFENSDFSVFVSNMSKDREIKAKLDQLAQVALEQQKADLSTIIDTILNDSPKDIINTLRKSEENFYKRQEEQQKSEQEHAKELQQLQAEHEQRVWDYESSEKQLDREKDIYIADQNNATKIQVQELANYFQNTSEDLDQDSIPDPMEIANHALKTQDINMKHYLAENKQRGDKALKEKELAIKENEFKNKLDIENKKIEQIKIQNKNQIELANKKAKLDEKLMNQKMKLEAMKARAAIAKSKANAKSQLDSLNRNIALINQQIAILNKICDEQVKYRPKSPVLAGIMSGIIPGSGKIYAGKTGEGIASIITNAGLGLIS